MGMLVLGRSVFRTVICLDHLANVTACGTIGQPMKNTAGECMEGPLHECAAPCAADGCADCTNDPCSGYKQSQCLKQGDPGETSPLIPEYEICLSFCTAQMSANPWTYLTYDQESQECICYETEEVDCSLEVIIYGMTEDMVANTCK